MTSSPPYQTDAHHYFSTECSDQLWTLIDKSERTRAQEEQMIALAWSSFWHWSQRKDFQPKHKSAAYWQLARVFSLVANKENVAEEFAQQCIDLCEEKGLPPLYKGYGYESLARVKLLQQDFSAAAEAMSKARNFSNAIENPHEKAFLDKELKDLERLMNVHSNL